MCHFLLRFLLTAVLLSAAGRSVVAADPLVLKGHTGVVAAVRFTPDGRSLISASWDETVQICDAVTGDNQVALRGHTDWVEAVALTADASRVVSASQRDVRTWDIASESLVSVFEAPRQFSISALTLSNDGRYLACGVRDGTVRIWEIGIDAPRWTFKTRDAWTKALAFSADAKLVAAGDWLGTLTVWNLGGAGTKVLEQNAHDGAPIAALAFRPDGGQLASGSYDASIKLWDTASWKLSQTLTGHKGLVLALAYSPDSQVLASGERHGVIKLWNPAGDVVQTIVAHPDEKLGFSVIGLAFSPDGKRLASCSFDRTAKIWPLE